MWPAECRSIAPLNSEIPSVSQVSLAWPQALATKLLGPQECSELSTGFPWISPTLQQSLARSGSLRDFTARSCAWSLSRLEDHMAHDYLSVVGCTHAHALCTPCSCNCALHVAYLAAPGWGVGVQLLCMVAPYGFMWVAGTGSTSCSARIMPYFHIGSPSFVGMWDTSQGCPTFPWISQPNTMAHQLTGIPKNKFRYMPSWESGNLRIEEDLLLVFQVPLVPGRAYIRHHIVLLLKHVMQ